MSTTSTASSPLAAPLLQLPNELTGLIVSHMEENDDLTLWAASEISHSLCSYATKKLRGRVMVYRSDKQFSELLDSHFEKGQFLYAKISSGKQIEKRYIPDRTIVTLIIPQANIRSDRELMPEYTRYPLGALEEVIVIPTNTSKTAHTISVWEQLAHNVKSLVFAVNLARALTTISPDTYSGPPARDTSMVYREVRITIKGTCAIQARISECYEYSYLWWAESKQVDAEIRTHLQEPDTTPDFQGTPVTEADSSQSSSTSQKSIGHPDCFQSQQYTRYWVNILKPDYTYLSVYNQSHLDSNAGQFHQAFNAMWKPLFSTVREVQMGQKTHLAVGNVDRDSMWTDM